MAGLSLEVKRVVHAPIERVFRAWTNADELKQWHSPEGMKLMKTQVDLRVGGSYRFTMQDTEGNVHEPQGEYQEIDPPHKLKMTWGWGEGTGPSTQITVLLKSLAADQTEITIKHEHFTSEASQTSHNEGWVSTLDHLEEFLSS